MSLLKDSLAIVWPAVLILAFLALVGYFAPSVVSYLSPGAIWEF